MKITAFVLSALGLASLTAAQNVYSTLTTALVNATTVNSHISVPVTPSPVRSNTYIRPTASTQCWRDGYPCGQNGGQRSQRLVADFVEPTPALNARVPPPEWFSAHPDVNMPGETGKPGDWIDILPIPTSIGETPLPKPTEETSMGIMPIPDQPRTYDAPPQSSSGDPIVSVLPITPSMTPTSTDFTSPPKVSAPTTSDVAGEPYTITIDCNRHYCTSGQRTIYTVTPEPYTYTNLPPVTSIFAVPPIPTPETEASIPIEWWRGPGQPIVPDAPVVVTGPIQRQSSVAPVPTDSSCWRHYCPPGHSASKVKSELTTMLTTTKLVQPIRSTSMHSLDAPSSVTTLTA